MSEQENTKAVVGENVNLSAAATAAAIVEGEGAKAPNNSDSELRPPQSQEKPSPQAAEIKKTPIKRTPSKRMSFIERAQKESEELVKNMGGSLELEGGRRTRSSTRGTPSRTVIEATPPPAKKARNSNTPASSGGSSTGTSTPKARGRARKLNIASPPKSPEKVEEPSLSTEVETKAKVAEQVENESSNVDGPNKATTTTTKTTESKESATSVTPNKTDETANVKQNTVVTTESDIKVAKSAEKVDTENTKQQKKQTVKDKSTVDSSISSSIKIAADQKPKVEDKIENVESATDNKIKSAAENLSSTTEEKKQNTVPVVQTKEISNENTTNHLPAEDAAMEAPESVMEIEETPEIVTPKNDVVPSAVVVQEKNEVPIAIITNEDSLAEKSHIIDENGTDFAAETTNEVPVAIQKESTPEPMEVDAVPCQKTPSAVVTNEDKPQDVGVQKVAENNVAATIRAKSPTFLSQNDAIKESFEHGAKSGNDVKVTLPTVPTYGLPTGNLGEKVVPTVHHESKKANDFCEPQIAVSPSIATTNDEGVSTPQFCN